MYTAYTAPTFSSQLLRVVVLSVSVVLLSSCLTSRVAAQEMTTQEIGQHFTLSVAPSSAYLMVEPGKSAVHTVVVRNKSNQSVVVKPKLVDFETDGTSGSPVLMEDTTFPYLENSEVLTDITLDADQQVSLPFIFKPPATAPAQEYHLTILFEYQHSDTPEALSSLVPTIGANLVVLVAGEKPASMLKIVSLQRAKLVDSFRPLDFRPLAQNLGQAATLASGSAVIRDGRGRAVASLPMYPDVVLAQSSRELRASKPASPVLPTDPDAVIATRLEPVAFTYKAPMLLGVYTIEFNFSDVGENGETAAVQRFTIIAFPFSALLVVLLCAGILAGVRFVQLRSHSHVQSLS